MNEEVARVAGCLVAEADDEADGENGIGWHDAYIAAMAEILGESA